MQKPFMHSWNFLFVFALSAVLNNVVTGGA